MKTIYEAEKVQIIDEEIIKLNHVIATHKIAKQQIIDRYLNKSQRITNQLVNLLKINNGHELSVLFNLPASNNYDALRCWVLDYLIEHDEYQSQQYSLTNMLQDFQCEVAVKQQDLYI